MRPGIQPASSWILGRFVAAEPQRERLTIALERSHPAGQGVRGLNELLDSEEHFRVAWDTHRWAVGTVPWVWLLLLESLKTRGPCWAAQPRNPLPHAQVEGSRGLTCLEFLLFFLQPALQRKHLVVQALSWRGGHSAPRGCPPPPPPSPSWSPHPTPALSKGEGLPPAAVAAFDLPLPCSEMLSFLAKCHLEDTGAQGSEVSPRPSPIAPPSPAPLPPRLTLEVQCLDLSRSVGDEVTASCCQGHQVPLQLGI